jgi:hypothetical protein
LIVEVDVRVLDNDFLEETAKFRAARKFVGELMTERYAPKDPRSVALRFHAQTAGVTGGGRGIGEDEKNGAFVRRVRARPTARWV